MSAMMSFILCPRGLLGNINKEYVGRIGVEKFSFSPRDRHTKTRKYRRRKTPVATLTIEINIWINFNI